MLEEYGFFVIHNNFSVPEKKCYIAVYRAIAIHLVFENILETISIYCLPFLQGP
jgi:hypothetical protein